MIARGAGAEGAVMVDAGMFEALAGLTEEQVWALKNVMLAASEHPNDYGRMVAEFDEVRRRAAGLTTTAAVEAVLDKFEGGLEADSDAWRVAITADVERLARQVAALEVSSGALDPTLVAHKRCIDHLTQEVKGLRDAILRHAIDHPIATSAMVTGGASTTTIPQPDVAAWKAEIIKRMAPTNAP